MSRGPGASARLAGLIAFVRRRGWRIVTDGQRLVLISRTGAVIRLGVPPVAQ